MNASASSEVRLADHSASAATAGGPRAAGSDLQMCLKCLRFLQQLFQVWQLPWSPIADVPIRVRIEPKSNLMRPYVAQRTSDQILLREQIAPPARARLPMRMPGSWAEVLWRIALSASSTATPCWERPRRMQPARGLLRPDLTASAASRRWLRTRRGIPARSRCPSMWRGTHRRPKRGKDCSRWQ